ncbi:kelch repeat-containing protein [Roseateles asaccharophilus]|uniref:Kelch motif protein n=1 Tax=Roseateles asaccharophilus TaxID=582607 RepID=A0ABU2A4M5_9BURK|nr:kelch repeat-containing protein [Roseateles asaccharophilus]MDR7331573.1 hypothetical protein [Roseateles asaccharophilus]
MKAFAFALWLAPAATLVAAPSPTATLLSVSNATAMLSARAAHQATATAQGLVLLSGGCAQANCDGVQRSAELFDPATGRHAPAGTMREARVAHTAAPLPDGRVLVAGGWTGAAVTDSVEVFDPATRRFTPAPAMATPRMDGTATPLADGRVLIAGGAQRTNQPTAATELFDPATGRLAPAGAMQSPRAHHGAVRLRDGRVLLVGGLVGRHRATASAEIYDPASGRFTPTGSLREPRCKLAALALQDGRVMVIAGSPNCEEGRRLASTEIWDPATGRFEPGPALAHPRYKIAAAAAVLASGDVLIAGNANDVEVWTPGTPAFTTLRGAIGDELSFSTATALPDGRALIAGGYDPRIVPTARAWQVARR